MRTTSRSLTPTPASASTERQRLSKGPIDAEGNEYQPQGSRSASLAIWCNGDRSQSDSHRSPSPNGGGFADFNDILSDLFGGVLRSSKVGGRALVGRSPKLIFTVDFLDAVKRAKRRVGLPDCRHLDTTISTGFDFGRVLRLEGVRD